MSNNNTSRHTLSMSLHYLVNFDAGAFFIIISTLYMQVVISYMIDLVAAAG